MAQEFRILLLTLGDAETWDSWSGSSKSLVDHLRAAGHSVECSNVELEGWRRWRTAFATFHRQPDRWRARFHFGREGFAARSHRAQAAVDHAADRVDVILQIGATFRVSPPMRTPLVLFCDSNIALAQEGADTGKSEAAVLTARDIEDIRQREGEVYRAARMIFTMSDRLARSFQEHFEVSPDHLTTIHAGPNFESGNPPPVPERTESGDPTILFIGRDFGRKGGDLLLSAFERVRRSVPAARLLIVGPDALPGGFGRLPDGVEFLGFLPKDTDRGRVALFEAYRRASVFCLPTRFEPFGVVFLEAMHYGLPCVGPRAWAVPEIVEHERTGLLVPPEDPEALAVSLVSLLVDPTRAMEMGKAGRERLDTYFSWARTVDRLTTGLNPVVNRSRQAQGDR